MTRSASDDSLREARLDQLLAEYLSGSDSGKAIDRDQFLDQHRDLAGDLKELLDTADLVDRMAGPSLLAMEMAAADQARSDETSPDSLPETIGIAAPVIPHGQDEYRGTESPGSPRSVADGPVLRQVGGYELLEEIGRGGMGVVYRARQIRLNRIVAVKMILSGNLASEADVQRFYREAQTAGGLRHPGIVSIHQVMEADGNHFYSMDYIEGKTLADVLSEGPLEPERAARYLRLLAEAVEYAHQQGVYHRDLKPANILIDANDRPQITDFGLAKRVGREAGLTLPGAAVGTPSYMPPEYAGGKRRKVGPTGDVYSLGAILYEMLTGEPPFRADSPLGTMYQVIHRQPRAPKSIRPGVDPDLVTICLKCLRKEPRRRYGSAGELVEEFDRLLRGEPIRAKPLGPVARAYYWVRGVPVVAALTGRSFAGGTPWHHRIQKIMLAVILLALLGWVGHALWPETLPRKIRIAGGAPGGMYHPLGKALADALGQYSGRPSMAVETEGSIDNRDRLLRREVDLALLQSSSFSTEEISIVTALYYEMVYVIARKDREIGRVADLRGKAVSLGPEGSGMRLSAVRVLEHCGVDLEELRRSDAYFTDLLSDTSLDAAIVTIGMNGSSGMADLLGHGDFVLLEIPDAEDLAEKHECFKPTHLHAEDLPVALELPAEGIPTVMTPAFLAARADASGKLVRTVLEALYQDKDLVAQYDLIPPERAADWQGWSMHPAAREFFRSQAGEER